MDLTKSPIDFHCGLESPFVFFRREWKAIAVFGGLFCLVLLAGVIWLDPAFFYPRLQTDPLLYYLKAQSLVESGSTAARVAVNTHPFPYAAMPGVLRAPVLLLFRDFDDQWRAIQVLNIPIVAAVALMSAYILSWVMPPGRHWIAIAFAFAFTAISPMWITNVYSPLADAPYAAFSLLGLLIAIHIVCRDSLRSAKLQAAMFCLLFVVAFLLRFTGPVMLVFVAVLAKDRWHASELAPWVKWALIIFIVLAVAVLIGVNGQAIFGRYFFEPIAFAKYGDKTGMLLNLFGVAIPDQIVPDFHLAFSQPPVSNTYDGSFGASRADLMLIAIGVLISSTVVLGAWLSRKSLLPEILYVLAPLPVLTLMLPSTSRYLMSYQPFFWVFFYLGVSALGQRFGSYVSKRSRLVIAGATLLIAVVAGALRWSRVAGTGSDRSFSVSMPAAPEYVTQVSSTFRALRTFLETLPKDRTLLIGSAGTTGRWKAIAGRSYYVPDTALLSTTRSKDVYMIVECGTLEYCRSFSEWKNHLEDRLCNFGEFNYEPVFAVRSAWARAEVYRVRPSA